MATEKITNILETIDSMTILELNELVKAIEEKYGVSAAAAVVAAPAAGAGAAAAEERPSSMQSWLTTALTRSASSRSSVRSPVWA